MAGIMTTKELAEYLRVHEATICKHAAAGKIPAKRVGRLWRFEKDVIDKWIRTGGRSTAQRRNKPKAKSPKHVLRKSSRKKGKTKSK